MKHVYDQHWFMNEIAARPGPLSLGHDDIA